MGNQRDDLFTQWCRDKLLSGGACDEAISKESEPYQYGFRRVRIRAFSSGIDVWLFKDADPCNCQSWHVEFGRVGGEMLSGLELDNETN